MLFYKFNYTLICGLIIVFNLFYGISYAFSYVWKEGFDGTLTLIGNSIIHNRHVKLAPGEGIGGSEGIEVFYQGNSEGSERVIYTAPLAEPSLDYTLSFAVKFCADFDFGKGGKLHGLGPLRPITGGHKATPEGWSARLMFMRDGGLMTYVYNQDMRGKYGDKKIAKKFRFISGQYYKIKMRVMLNNPATERNGKIEVDVDGVRVIEHGNLRFRSLDGRDGMIQTFLFNTFHGGNSADWAPRTFDGIYKRDCAYFDDFVISN